jgi:hypothetical protein
VFLVSNFSQSWKISARDLSFIHAGRHSHLHLFLSLTLLLPGQTASKLSIRWWPHGLCLDSWAASKGIQLLCTNTSSLTALDLSLFITHTHLHVSPSWHIRTISLTYSAFWQSSYTTRYEVWGQVTCPVVLDPTSSSSFKARHTVTDLLTHSLTHSLFEHIYGFRGAGERKDDFKSFFLSCAAGARGNEELLYIIMY